MVSNVYHIEAERLLRAVKTKGENGEKNNSDSTPVSDFDVLRVQHYQQADREPD